MALWALLSACALRVQVATVPEGALLWLPDGQAVTAPAVARLPLGLGDQPVTADLAGYRPLTLDLRGRGLQRLDLVEGLWHPLRGLRKAPSRRVTLVLVPEHGTSGTWTPEDQGLTR